MFIFEVENNRDEDFSYDDCDCGVVKSIYSRVLFRKLGSIAVWVYCGQFTNWF